jgi:hypothetical protein
MHLQRCKTRVDQRKETCRLLHVEYVASVGLFARRAMHHQPQHPCPLVLFQLVRDLAHSHWRAPARGARHPDISILYPSCCYLRDQDLASKKLGQQPELAISHHFCSMFLFTVRPQQIEALNLLLCGASVEKKKETYGKKEEGRLPG